MSQTIKLSDFRVPFVMIDRAGMIVGANEELGRMVGENSHAFIGQRLTDTFFFPSSLITNADHDAAIDDWFERGCPPQPMERPGVNIWLTDSRGHQIAVHVSLVPASKGDAGLAVIVPRVMDDSEPPIYRKPGFLIPLAFVAISLAMFLIAPRVNEHSTILISIATACLVGALQALARFGGMETAAIGRSMSPASPPTPNRTRNTPE